MAYTSIDYDSLSYPNYVFCDTHPSRLSAIGRLFGLNTTNSKSAKILELGCAGGMNTLSHACSLPTAEFTAIDASQKQIQKAKELQKLAGITNINFLHKRIEEVGSSLGCFDYIICHGVFSWVKSDTQHEILRLCTENLSENGIAFISYNTLPGWHIQKIIRDALKFRVESSSASENPAEICKSYLRFIKDLLPKAAQPLLSPRIDHLLKTEDSYLAHEFLAEENTAFYFRQFHELCQLHGLSYLADSELGSMIPKEFEPSVQDQITDLSEGSLAKLEQNCDFLRLRQFRKSLLCKSSCKINREINIDRIKPLYLSSSKAINSENYSPKNMLPSGSLKKLDQIFPLSISAELLLEQNSHDKNIYSQLIENIILDNIEIRDQPHPIKPLAPDGNYSLSCLASALLPSGRELPNLRSDTVRISQATRLALLSGENLKTLEREEISKLGLIG